MVKVILQGFILVPDSDIEVIKRELVKHKHLTLKEVGCLIFTVTPDQINPNKFNVYEEFIDQAAFEYHQSRVKLSRWGRATKNVERHYSQTLNEQ